MSGLQPTSPRLRLSTEDARTRPDVLGVVICSRTKLRLRTEVLTNESKYSLEHDAFVPFETCSRRAYNGSNWVDDCEYIRNMWWPGIMPYSVELFLKSARMLQCAGSADPAYDTKVMRLLVNVPVGPQTRVRHAGGTYQFETNESTCVCIELKLDSKEFRSWGAHEKIWCDAFELNIVRNVDTLVLSRQLQSLHNIGSAQALVQNIGKASLSLGTAQTLVWTCGPFTLVVTRVLAHLPCKQERAPDDARAMPAEHPLPSAVIWVYWTAGEEFTLVKRYDVCDLSKSKVVETIMYDSVQLIEYTISVHSVQGTQHPSRSLVEVDEHVLSAVKTIWQEWSK
jgi:hypothetical protein